MDSLRRKKLQIVAAIVIIFVFGTLGYYVIEEDWTLLDAFYMVAISITTVGFGEIHSLSPAGRIFTVVLIFMGLGLAATFAAHLARFIVEYELRGIFGRKKMQERIKRVKDHYIVCGYGGTGATICLKLYEREIPFIVVDADEDALELAAQRSYLTVKGNAANDSTLLSAGVERASGIVTCIPDDASALFISLAARELNPEIHIITQGEDPKTEARMIRAGVDTVVYPLKLGGEQIARLIAGQYGKAEEAETGGPECDIMGFSLTVYRHFEDGDIRVREAAARAGAVQVLSLRREDGETVNQPAGDEKVGSGDSIVMVLHRSDAAGAGGERASEEIVWSDDLSVGITAIDEEHRTLVILANEFRKALSAGRGREEVAGVFDKLLDYTVQHFTHEEGYMRKYDYPGMEVQIREHRSFTRQVMELNKDKKYVFPENVSDFLYSWLKHHIMDIDKELGRFLRERNVR
jgi:voltage-gated potassium channel